MKAAIITLHRVFNYGSVLQAYATQEVFRSFGCETEIIDYITEQRTNKRLFLSLPLNIQNKNWIYKIVYMFLRGISILLKKKTFWGFLKKNVHLSNRKYISVADLEKNAPIADIYIAGSDQIWNSVYNEGIDRGFFLDFVHGKKKAAFASSFGKSELDNWETVPIRKYLADFSAISVREAQAVNIIKRLGLDASCVLDPTLLLKREQWLRLASKPLMAEPYLLLMLLYNEDNGATEYAKKTADEKKLKLVKLSWELKRPPMVDVLMTHRSPEDFLSLFAYADFIVTNSYHGLAFSINLNKQFVVFPRNEYNSRIESLLETTRLFKRMITDNEWKSLQYIDYDSVNSILDRERKHTFCFVKKILEME